MATITKKSNKHFLGLFLFVNILELTTERIFYKCILHNFLSIIFLQYIISVCYKGRESVENKRIYLVDWYFFVDAIERYNYVFYTNLCH